MKKNREQELLSRLSLVQRISLAEAMELFNTSESTIRRLFTKLEQDGNVMKYTGEHGEKATYQLVERDHHCDSHLHLRCTDCGSVIHLDCHFMDEIAGHIASDHGFALQCKNSVIYGLCQNCQTK